MTESRQYRVSNSIGTFVASGCMKEMEMLKRRSASWHEDGFFGI